MTPIYNIIDNWKELHVWIKADTINKNTKGWFNLTIPKKHIKREIVQFWDLDNIY